MRYDRDPKVNGMFINKSRDCLWTTTLMQQFSILVEKQLSCCSAFPFASVCRLFGSCFKQTQARVTVENNVNVILYNFFRFIKYYPLSKTKSMEFDIAVIIWCAGLLTVETKLCDKDAISR